MNERLSELQTIRRTRISGTGPLAFPIATIVAHEMVVNAQQGHYDGVAASLSKIADADELMILRAELSDQGFPFDTFFHVDKPEGFQALQGILGRSSEAQLSEFSDSLTLLEMDVFSRFKS